MTRMSRFQARKDRHDGPQYVYFRWRVACILGVLIIAASVGCQRAQEGEAANEFALVAQGVATRRPVDRLHGTWSVVERHVNGRPAPATDGEQWAFDGELLHESYDEGTSHSPHGPRRYEIRQLGQFKMMFVESYGGDLIVMNPALFELEGDTLKFQQDLVIVRLKRVSNQILISSNSRRNTDEFRVAVDSGQLRGQNSRLNGRWRLVQLVRSRKGKARAGAESDVEICDGRIRHLSSSDPHRIPPRIYFRLHNDGLENQIDLLIDSTDGIWGGVNYFAGIYEHTDDTLKILVSTIGGRPRRIGNAPSPLEFLWELKREAR